MNLELLISKYLDGDLTPEEDQLLRKIISEEPLAREEFEGAALLHVEMQDDAEGIIPPADLVSQTEDLIMMRILNHSVQDSGRPVFFLKMPFRRIANVFSMAVMLLAFTIPFKDGSLEIPGNSDGLFSANQSTNVNLDLLKDFASRDAVLKTDALVKTTFKKNALKGSGDLSSQTVLGENASPVENSVQASAAKDVTPESSFTANEIEFLKTSPTITEAIRNSSPVVSNGNGSNWAMGETAAAADNSVKDAGYNISSEVNSKDEVQVSTFLATNVFKNAKSSESAIASVSQSVSYGINSKDRVGVEMGYSSYTYEGNALLAVRSTSGKPGGIVIMGAGADDKPQPPGNDETATQPTWSQQIMPYVEQGRMYWGAAFYERQVVRSGNMSLHGRLGVGGSGEGGVAYGRVFGKYDFFSVVSLTVGAESRALVKTPASVQNAEVNAAVSLMYGLQIRF